jgi:hypothetical protein
MQKEITKYIYYGFFEASQSLYTALILFTRKGNNKFRFCINFRKLNEITRKDCYLIPLIDETLVRIGRTKVFTKLDIQQAFYKIRIDLDSE